jgi:hypothetical protein
VFQREGRENLTIIQFHISSAIFTIDFVFISSQLVDQISEIYQRLFLIVNNSVLLFIVISSIEEKASTIDFLVLFQEL